MRTVVIGIVVVGALAGGVAFFLHGHEHGDNDHGGHEHSRGEAEKAGHSHANIQAHGGDVTMTQRHHFEVVFREASVRVYAYSQSQEPIAAKGLSGTAKLVKKGSDKPTEATLNVATDSAEAARDFLEAPLDLKGIEPGAAKLTVDISGLSDAQEPKVSFTATFNGAQSPAKRAEAVGAGHEHH